MFSLDGKVCFVTGGASGIGRAVTQRFIAAGATAVIADLADGSNVAKEIGAHFVTVDVSDESKVAAAIADAASEHGKLDVLVNNAGIVARETGSTLPTARRRTCAAFLK